MPFFFKCLFKLLSRCWRWTLVLTIVSKTDQSGSMKFYVLAMEDAEVQLRALQNHD
jgi:hypothetical protein